MQPRRLTDQHPSPLVDQLDAMFDRAVTGYLWALDQEEWSALFEYGEIIDKIHHLAERLAA